MATLSLEEIALLLQPYAGDLPEPLLSQLSTYLDLLVKWNARTNLSSIRNPKEIVQRHFGEALFTSARLPDTGTLLDFGSGAGFPGLPIALAKPTLRVTLAESQNKKAAFLREVVRVLAVSVEVWSQRAELLPGARRFDLVTMRAVDKPSAALESARLLLVPGGKLYHLTSGSAEGIAVPLSRDTILKIY